MDGHISIKMRYAEIIETLFKKFPFLEQRYLEEGEYILGLPHPIFSIVFVPYIRETVNNNDVWAIECVCEFFEEMANSIDEMVRELLMASVLENILPERTLIKTLKKHLKVMTMKLLLSMEKACGWDPS